MLINIGSATIISTHKGRQSAKIANCPAYMPQLMLPEEENWAVCRSSRREPANRGGILSRARKLCFSTLQKIPQRLARNFCELLKIINVCKQGSLAPQDSICCGSRLTGGEFARLYNRGLLKVARRGTWFLKSRKMPRTACAAFL